MPQADYRETAADPSLSKTDRRSTAQRRGLLDSRRLPFAVWVLLVYLAAITIFGKGPTYLGYPPVYWGEIVLGLGLLWILSSKGATGLRNYHLRPLSASVLLFMAHGAALTCVSFSEWGPDAWRDAAIWYYAGFYFIGINIARFRRLGSRVWRAVCGFWVVALVWGVAETLSGNALSRLSPVIPWRGVHLLASSHSDLMQNMVLGAILVLCALRARRSVIWRNLLYAAAVTGFVLFLLSYGRGVKVGLGLGILCVIALNLRHIRSVRFSSRLYRLLVLGVLALVLVVTALGLGFADIGHLGRFEEVSLDSDYGSVHWRLVWWEHLMDELLDRNLLFGLGFGENLGLFNPYLAANENSNWPIRAPHNVNVTVLSRMGLVGLALWMSILVRGLGGLYLRAWRAGVGTRPYPSARREEISFWLLMLVTTWGNGSFGVLMEGPVLGIWFWFALGFSSGRSVAYRGARAAVRPYRRQYSFLRPALAENPS